MDEHRLDDYEPLGLVFAMGAYVYQRTGQTDRAVVRVAEGRRRTGVAAEGHGGGVREKWRARRSEWRAGRNERGARQENGSKRGARAPG